MKTLSLLMINLILLSLFQIKAAGIEDVKAADELVWFGIDYTKVQCIEDAEGSGFTNPNDIVNRMFQSWNGLFISEKDKYDLQGIFKKNEIKYNNESVNKLNSKVDPNQLVKKEASEFSEDQLAGMIKKYDSGGNSGIGLVFIAETLNKATEKGSYHLVFFDIESRKILFSKKMQGDAGGFGFRNYWAKSFYLVLDDAEKQYKKKW
ncbi:MAG: hypothetical protein WD048_00300 [Chitinophagales bacterium]